MEFDFTTDRYDIRVPSDVLESTTESNQRPGRQDYSVPESEYSLRVSISDLSWPHGTHEHPVALGEDPHTERRVRDQTFMMQY